MAYLDIILSSFTYTSTVTQYVSSYGWIRVQLTPWITFLQVPAPSKIPKVSEFPEVPISHAKCHAGSCSLRGRNRVGWLACYLVSHRSPVFGHCRLRSLSRICQPKHTEVARLRATFALQSPNGSDWEM